MERGGRGVTLYNCIVWSGTSAVVVAVAPPPRHSPRLPPAVAPVPRSRSDRTTAPQPRGQTCRLRPAGSCRGPPMPCLPHAIPPSPSAPPPPRPPPPRDASQRRPQQRLDRRLEEVAKAVGGGLLSVTMPCNPALGVRGTVAVHRLGALKGGGGGAYPPPETTRRNVTRGAPPPPPVPMHPCPPPQPPFHIPSAPFPHPPRPLRRCGAVGTPPVADAL